jgi:sodium-dependent dicarboxylate transporter 2/3/5
MVLIIISGPEGLSAEGRKATAVFLLCLSLWVTGYLPLAITSLMGIALIPLLGILSPTKTYAIFGNNAIFFILGALMLAAALYKTGLGTRIAYRLIVFFDDRPSKIVAGIIITSASLSCIMPEHAVAAMLFPIVFEIARSLNLKPLESNFGKALFLSLAWGAVIGGVTTFLGGARNILAVSILQKNYDMTIGFFEWIKYSFPFSLILLIVAYFMIIKVFPPEIESVAHALDDLEGKIEEKGGLSKDEKRLIFIFATVIFSWVVLSSYIDISVTAILGGVMIFVLNIIDWKDMEEYINWGVILMYGGAIVVATALTNTGAARWMADRVFSVIPLSPVIFILLFALVTKLLTEGVSNVAAVAIIIPLAFSVGSVINLNPVAITLIIALPGGLAFCLPMGAPPNAIAFSSGYLNIAEVVKLGLIMNIVSIIVIYLVSKFYWPLVGLKLIL